MCNGGMGTTCGYWCVCAHLCFWSLQKSIFSSCRAVITAHFLTVTHRHCLTEGLCWAPRWPANSSQLSRLSVILSCVLFCFLSSFSHRRDVGSAQVNWFTKSFWITQTFWIAGWLVCLFIQWRTTLIVPSKHWFGDLQVKRHLERLKQRHDG